MILYRPDGTPLNSSLNYKPRTCFLITRLGMLIDDEAKKMRQAITKVARKKDYKVIDAAEEVTGRDFLNKIWEYIASTPLSIGLLHESFPFSTCMNIFYELGMARALGKESIVIKSANSEYPSDLVRDEYIEFNQKFPQKFSS